VAIWFGVKYYLPCSESVKTGYLDYIVYEGFVFKTYEGKLHIAGIQNDSVTEAPPPAEYLKFSVASKKLAEELMCSGGKIVELRVKEYLGVLPWRGSSHYVVTKIAGVTDDIEEPQRKKDAEAPKTEADSSRIEL
jgi:hypothetical protein